MLQQLGEHLDLDPHPVDLAVLLPSTSTFALVAR